MMFKIFLGGGPTGGGGSGEIVNTIPAAAPKMRPAGAARKRRAALLLSLPLLLAGCASVSSKLPPANLQQPGWTVHQGQAVWHLEHSTRDIAGDVMVATRPDGTAFVQFSKSPFPLVIAQENAHQWQVEFPPQNKHYAGRGNPPKRLIWLYLPRVLTGHPPPKGWTWQQDASGWKLVNTATGESLEGFFNDSTAAGPTAGLHSHDFHELLRTTAEPSAFLGCLQHQALFPLPWKEGKGEGNLITPRTKNAMLTLRTLCEPSRFGFRISDFS